MKYVRVLSLALGCLLLVLFVQAPAFACTTVVVGKDASADGCVLIAHNEDDGPPQVVLLEKIPSAVHGPDELLYLSSGAALEQSRKTWGFLWLHLPEQPFSESGLNEWGVCITSDNCPSREDREDFTDGGIGPGLRRIVIERARTAREGVGLIGELVERFGYQASGRTYIICDPDEAWLVCLVRGRHWLAWRVPDDEVCVVANSFVVRQVSPSDHDRIVASADIVDYARDRGWSDPQLPFDFARAYADTGRAGDPANYGRQWSMLRRFAETPPEYGMNLPASVRPKKKIAVPDLMAALRDHYEGTQHYHPDAKTGDPHGGSPRTVCAATTQTAFVAQLRPGEPREVRLAWWVCLSLPCTSCFTPFHYGIAQIPPGWQSGGPAMPDEETWQSWLEPPFRPDAGNAFATALNCGARVQEDYSGRIKELRRRLDGIEAEALRGQKSFEDEVCELWRQDPIHAAAKLSEFSTSLYLSSQKAMSDVLMKD